ncbi:hypothetical protein [Stutzerimonas chloritidismutans]
MKLALASFVARLDFSVTARHDDRLVIAEWAKRQHLPVLFQHLLDGLVERRISVMRQRVEID